MMSKDAEKTPANRPVTRNDVMKKYREMPVEEKRRHYTCGDAFKTLADVLKWPEYARLNRLKLPAKNDGPYPARADLNERVSVWQGDITQLEVDAIVNAANSNLWAGGGVCGSIHRAAGSYLEKECDEVGPCATGDAVTTCGYKLPARYVIHAVGPTGERPQELASAYKRSLEEMAKAKMKSIAFPCISTGIYGYANERAAPVAIKAVRDFLEHHAYASQVDRIIFCLFLSVDVHVYHELMPVYFPIPVGDEEKHAPVKAKHHVIS